MKAGPVTILWLIGPQLIGAMILLVGWIQQTWPPKNINNFYGYRTGSSMKNQQTWDEANRYSARLMIKWGIVLIIAGFMLSAVINAITMSNAARSLCLIMPCMACGIGSAVLMMVKTEKHLLETFDEKEK